MYDTRKKINDVFENFTKDAVVDIHTMICTYTTLYQI